MLQITVDALPSDSIDIVLLITTTAARDPLEIVPLFPSKLYFASTSAALSSGVALIGISTNGQYVINATVLGPSKDEYRVAYSNGNTLEVISATQEPTAPLLMSAQLSGDGSFSTLAFNSATNQGGGQGSSSFTCSTLLAFQGSATSDCQWSSDSRSLALFPGPGVIINVGDSVTLLSGTLKAMCPETARDSCSDWRFSPETTVTVLPPLTPTLPSVVISAPDTIGEHYRSESATIHMQRLSLL